MDKLNSISDPITLGSLAGLDLHSDFRAAFEL